MIKRYWLSLVVSLFCLLAFTVDDQARVLAQLPTPDVNTVPDLQDLYTRTPTPTAVPVVIVTATPESPSTELPSTELPSTELPSTESTNGSPDGQTNGSTNGSTSVDDEEEQRTTNSNSDPATTPTDVEISAPSSELAAGTPVSRATRTGIVNTQSLNVRAAPNTTSTIIDQLERNAQVTLLQQDETLRWWYICCGTTNKLQGWVTAQYLTIDAVAPVGLPDGIAEAEAQPALQIQLIPAQHFVWQGQPLTVQVVVTNPKTVPIPQLTIRTDLPPEIHFVTATTSLAGSQQVDHQSTEQTVVTLSWPEIAAKTQVVATLNLEIATEAINGSFIDLIATIDATGEATIVTGISVIMPPDRLPSFP